MFYSHPSLFEPLAVEEWEPHALTHDEWPRRDYRAVYAWRMARLEAFKHNPTLLQGALAYYARPENAATFIMHWLDTYDPRKEGIKWLPFVMFEKQAEFINFLNSCVTDSESGLVEKARDMGATWLCVCWSVWAWRFQRDIAIGWGSRKQELVDRLGDMDSIFEKIRQSIDRLPAVFRPNYTGAFMKVVNHDNGASITGESGDNIGRGGRKRIYFKDESAHYERPELIEAALGDNTNTQIDISSVNGTANVFYRRRKAGVDWPFVTPGKTRVFVFRYSDHPEKTKEWYERRRSKYENEGMAHIFAQEVDRNYAAAISNAIIPLAWLEACRDAHKRIPGMLDGPNHGGFDVADEGLDTNAISRSKGRVLLYSEEWGDRDPGAAARRVIIHFNQFGKGTIVNYDNIGVGAAVKSEINRLVTDKEAAFNVLCDFVGWNAGAAVQHGYEHVIEDDNETPLNKDYFQNMKAQAWWSMRMACMRTYQRIVQGREHPADKCISFASSNPLIEKLIEELAQPVMVPGSSLKMVIDKKPEGSKSPNLADAAVMDYFPILDGSSGLLIGGRN